MGPANGILGPSYKKEPRANYPESSNPDTEIGVTDMPSQESEEEDVPALKGKDKAARDKVVEGEKQLASTSDPIPTKVPKGPLLVGGEIRERVSRVRL